LKFTLGSRENINEISENKIERLEIVRVRGFKNFRNLDNFCNLKSLLLAYEPQLKHINFNTEFYQLLDLRLVFCKNLLKIKGVKNLKKINELRIAGTSIEFDKFIKQEFPQSLEIFAFNTLRIKRDKLIKAELEKLGYSDGIDHNYI
jgi:hypothetical protein